MIRLLLVVLLLAPMAAIWAVSIELHDGRVLHGELDSSKDADPLILVVEQAGMRAHMRITQADVARIREDIDPEQAAIARLRRQLAAALQDPAASADNVWELAQGLEDHDAQAELRAAARAVLRRFADYPPARELLGYELVDGKWLNFAEARRAEGLEWYDGRWRDIQEVERLRTIAQAEREERQRQADLRRVQRRWAAEERRRRWHEPAATIPVVNLVRQPSYFHRGHSCPWSRQQVQPRSSSMLRYSAQRSSFRLDISY